MADGGDGMAYFCFFSNGVAGARDGVLGSGQRQLCLLPRVCFPPKVESTDFRIAGKERAMLSGCYLEWGRSRCVRCDMCRCLRFFSVARSCPFSDVAKYCTNVRIRRGIIVCGVAPTTNRVSYSSVYCCGREAHQMDVVFASC